MRQLSTVIDDDVQPCIGSLADTDSEAEITILVLTDVVFVFPAWF